ncbi:DUF2339 domain-containing protein [Pseudoalteromonas sp.]|uniref:DUF2339 domain-containing protein n=1 Tax=Pseudoalteromonas sp. TaxID=53249 RepID=UPI003564EF93
MDELIGLAGLLIVALIAGAICGFIAITQLNSLKHQVAQLTAKVASLQQSVQAAAVVSKPPSDSVPPTTVAAEVKPSGITLRNTSAPFAKTANINSTANTALLVTRLVAKLRSGFEQHWMTWIGAIALALGGIFLAKYSLDAGLLSPVMRLSLGALFGVALIATAAYLHFKRIVFEGFNNYIPAALASGGFISCFALTLLAYSSYDMISPSVAFIVLAFIAITASAMALQLGPLLAILGIVGAYSVPIWVSSNSVNLAALFMYVGFVSLSAALVAHRVQRSWLWYLLWAGHIFWYLAGFALLENNTIWLQGIYAIASIIGLIAIPRLGLRLAQIETRPHSLKRLIKLLPDHPLLLVFIAPFILLMLLHRFDLQFQLVSLLVLVLMLFLVLKNSRWDGWQALCLVIALAVLVSSQQTFDFDDALFIFKHEYGLGLVLGFALTAYGLYFGNQFPKRLAFHISGAFSLFLMVATLYALIPNSALSTAYPLWAMVLLVGSAVLIKTAQHSASLYQRFSYWIAANANITLAITMLLSDSGLTLALATQVLLISLLLKRHSIAMPHWPIKALVAALLLRLTFAPWTLSYDALTIFSLHWSIVVYPLCTALFYVTARCFNTSTMQFWLEGAALHCLALFITTETSYQLVGHYPQFDSLSFYEQILLTCNWLGLACVYCYRARFAGSLAKLYYRAGLVLAGAAGVLALKTLLDDNPLFSNINVGDTALFNWLLLLWLVPAGLTVWLAKLIATTAPKLIMPLGVIAGSLTLLAINSLLRQYWQGPYINLAQATSHAELYSYSVMWLLLGAVTVIYGHLKQQLLLQKIGLALLAAVIIKVFLIDMAHLTGLLKALSFIGLGLSLVGLSWLFQKLRTTALPAAG